MTTKSHHSPFAVFLTVILFLIMLIAIPVTVVYLGLQTRTQSKAAQACKNPPVPAPQDCVGGQWKLFSDENNCVRFICEVSAR